MIQPPPEWVTVTVPKIGNRPEENEDATAVAPDGLRFAVADGATEAWEAGPWAARLGAAYVERPPGPADFLDWLAAVRRGWAPQAPDPVPWYAEAKREEGSFATLVGLELRARPPGWAWKAVAVGDSCLLHVSGARIVAAFPLSSPAEFGRRPALVPSSPAVGCPEPAWFAGRAAPGDLLLLATDAAAARLLSPPALAPALAAVLSALDTRAPAPLAHWCHGVQAQSNDDVSVVAIRLPPVPEPL